MNEGRKPRIALMSYPMDNRKGKGTALYTRKLIENLLVDDRFEFYLVHYDTVDDPLYKKAHEIIMPQIRLPFATRFVRQMLFFWKYRHERFDIIHWFLPRLYPFFWLAPARRLVVTMHGAGDVTAPGAFPLSRKIFNFVLTHFNSRISAIIADTEHAKREIAEHYGADSARIHAIPLGGGENYHPMARGTCAGTLKRYGIAPPYILDVSRLDAHKNVGTLVRAYQGLRERHPLRKEKLVVVGAKGNAFEATRALIDVSVYRGDIMLITYVDQADLNAIYAGAELFVFPSLDEGFGLPIIEAFASGTPVVTSNVSCLPEIAADAAAVVDPQDALQLARAMTHVLSDATLKNNLIAKGLARAKLFVWARTASRTTALYQSLLHSGI